MRRCDKYVILLTASGRRSVGGKHVFANGPECECAICLVIISLVTIVFGSHMTMMVGTEWGWALKLCYRQCASAQCFCVSAGQLQLPDEAGYHVGRERHAASLSAQGAEVELTLAAGCYCE